MKTLRIGVAGLGRAFALMAPAFRDPRVELVAAADPRAEACQRFKQDYAGKTFTSVEELCADPAVDVVYVATPHELHAAHARSACSRKKHVLVEKPMALSLAECRAMVDAARENGVQLLVGHSHSFDVPVLRTRELIQSGAYGPARMITALDFTDWVYRPRRPEEFRAAVQNQAAHQVDITRLFAGGRVRSVRAFTGSFDPQRSADAAWSCQLRFDNGVFASLVYSGYAHFDSDEFMGWIGEMGQKKDPAAHGGMRAALRGDELAVKNARNYGGANFTQADAVAHQHFGVFIVSCERADLRPLPNGVMIYADGDKRLEPLPAPTIPRVEVIDELYAAVVGGQAPLHDGAWAMATLQVCLALLDSARSGKEVLL
ncbi:MAG TPA: Gfo/Idh/MocA family oxidoreductase [Burkholderiales bacterium]|nr:Gfo/Idh/MocA family oxidoreductase [Burkholderiales bacterium]